MRSGSDSPALTVFSGKALVGFEKDASCRRLTRVLVHGVGALQRYHTDNLQLHVSVRYRFEDS
eukprot:SAG11_NODE_1309_length_5238_cov_64.494260_3_plen_63_part_00